MTHTRLIRPALSRPEAPYGERAIRLARLREHCRIGALPDPAPAQGGAP